MMIQIPEISDECKLALYQLWYKTKSMDKVIETVCSLVQSYELSYSFGEDKLGGCLSVDELFNKQNEVGKVILNEFKKLYKEQYSTWDFQLIAYAHLITVRCNTTIK